LLLAHALAGFALSLSLILAIGAQNAFVLRQGLSGRHVLLVCSICSISDAVLIILGVFVVGELVAQSGNANVLEIAAVAFLMVYALTRFRAAYHGSNGLDMNSSEHSESALKVFVLTMGFTWLNPHVYLDTLLLIGGSAAGLGGGQRMAFAAGAALASFVFFFSLGFGARSISHRISEPRTWQWIDAGVGIAMLLIAMGIWLG
jgi:L-lysine exporter family protein LysE/ArgO